MTPPRRQHPPPSPIGVADPQAVQWDDDMAARFPDVTHEECRVLISGGRTTIICRGLHCSRCGQATNTIGHRACEQP